MQSGRRHRTRPCEAAPTRDIFPRNQKEEAHHKAQKAPLLRRQRGESGENGGESRLYRSLKREKWEEKRLFQAFAGRFNTTHGLNDVLIAGGIAHTEALGATKRVTAYTSHVSALSNRGQSR